MQQGSRNALIEDLLRRLLARINFLCGQSMSAAGRSKFSLLEMRTIFQAIERGDSKTARKAAQAHVKNAAAAAARAKFETGLVRGTTASRHRAG
jgi:DNA-binding GntR family transcriptional regulator